MRLLVLSQRCWEYWCNARPVHYVHYQWRNIVFVYFCSVFLRLLLPLSRIENSIAHKARTYANKNLTNTSPRATPWHPNKFTRPCVSMSVLHSIPFPQPNSTRFCSTGFFSTFIWSSVFHIAMEVEANRSASIVFKSMTQNMDQLNYLFKMLSLRVSPFDNFWICSSYFPHFFLLRSSFFSVCIMICVSISKLWLPLRLTKRTFFYHFLSVSSVRYVHHAFISRPTRR